MPSSTASFTKIFSHIYIEQDIQDHPVTQNILNQLPGGKPILIDNYARIFNRHHQDFCLQKRSPKLILAKKRQDFFYPGSPYCEAFGHQRFYYTGMIMNCLYNCSYCYLKSIYPCGHIVIFVNIEDFIEAVKHNLLADGAPLYLALSYDSDLMALNRLTGFIEPWMALAESCPQLTLEIKTKAPFFEFKGNLPSNVIFAWSLLPQEAIDRYELKTPSLSARLKAVRQALHEGARVRLSLEPLMPVPDADTVYPAFAKTLASSLDLHQILDINLGGFRISGKQFKTFSKKDPYCPVFAYPLTEKQSHLGYEAEDELLHILYKSLINYIDSKKMIIYHENS